MAVYPFDTQRCSAIFDMKGNSGKFAKLKIDKMTYLGPIDLTQYFVENYRLVWTNIKHFYVKLWLQSRRSCFGALQTQSYSSRHDFWSSIAECHPHDLPTHLPHLPDVLLHKLLQRILLRSHSHSQLGLFHSSLPCFITNHVLSSFTDVSAGFDHPLHQCIQRLAPHSLHQNGGHLAHLLPLHPFLRSHLANLDRESAR